MIEALHVVSVPLRGNGYRKYQRQQANVRRCIDVSVPLRGNGYRKSGYILTLPTTDGSRFRPLAG